MIISVLGEDSPAGAPHLSYAGGKDFPCMLISHGVGSLFLDCSISALGLGLFLRLWEELYFGCFILALGRGLFLGCSIFAMGGRCLSALSQPHGRGELFLGPSISVVLKEGLALGCLISAPAKGILPWVLHL